MYRGKCKFTSFAEKIHVALICLFAHLLVVLLEFSCNVSGDGSNDIQGSSVKNQTVGKT